MNQREKILTTVILTLAVLAGGYVLHTTTSGYLSFYTGQAQQEKKKLDALNATIKESKKAEKILKDLRKRALTSNESAARSAYQEWLLELADKGIQLSEVDIKSQKSQKVKNLYHRHGFSLSASGTPMQIVHFLYQFYSVDHLHRISSMTISPITETKLYDLKLQIDVVAFQDNPKNKPFESLPFKRLKKDSLADYKESVLRRDLFSMNSKPTIRTRRESGYNDIVEFTVEANDPNPLDNLQYHLVTDNFKDQGIPNEAIHLDPDTGDLFWALPDIGEYEIKIRVTDDGLPAMSAEQTVSVRISERPKPEVTVTREVERFDRKPFTFLTGITEVSGRKQAWITERTSGQLFLLFEGDTLKIDDFEATVSQISPRTIHLTTAEGILQLDLGSNLGQANQISSTIAKDKEE
ncbi:MAG: hypothetical protein MPJ24_04615 [Pirellulaceae bacterium]|nr:hypothetical protein [Pirellulaceae bacterium]